MGKIGVKIKATLVSKSMMTNPLGERLIRLEFAEERDMPGPIIVQETNNPLARDIVPIVSQVLRSLPMFGGKKTMMHRLTLFLTEDEWESLPTKPDIGDEVLIIVKGEQIEIRKSD